MTRLAANLTLIIVGSILGYLLWNDNIEIDFDSNEETPEINLNKNQNITPTNYEIKNLGSGKVIDTYENGEKKTVIKSRGEGEKYEVVERIEYDIKGEIIEKINHDTKESMKTFFNQNEKKIKEISLTNEKPTRIWEYYDENGESIGTIDFNKKTSLSKILGEWVLEQENHNIKKIFFKDKMLEQWKIDVNGQFWIDLGIDEYRCPQILGEDICQDKQNYNNHLSYQIEYPTIESIKDKQHIIVNTSKIEFYGTGIENIEKKLVEEKRKVKNGFYIQLIDDSTLMITEDGNVFKYKKVY